MNFIYCDAALVSEQGHFATHCRFIVNRVRELQIDSWILSHRAIQPLLAAALGATPFFRFHPHARPVEDPLSGWLTNFIQVAAGTTEDLCRLRGVTKDSILYYEHAKPAQLMALVAWAQQTFLPGDCPRIVITFGWRPGVLRNPDANAAKQWIVRETDALLYRHAALMLRDAHAERFVFAAFAEGAAETYQFLTKRPVHCFPAPYRATAAQRDRTAVTCPTIAFLGEQRAEKGFALVPDIVRRLLAARGAIRILVHNSWDQFPEENAALRELAATDSRLEFLPGTVSSEQWNELLGRSDIVVLPYDPQVYKTAISAVGMEAIANSIPVISPEGTAMARLMKEYGMPGVVSQDNNPSSVVSAIMALLDDYPGRARQAAAAGVAWGERAGAAVLVERILGLGH